MYMPTSKQFMQSMEKLEKFLNYYKEQDCQNKKYILFLSNGTALEFGFEPSYLATLLGIHMGTAKELGLVKSFDFLTQLEEFVANKEAIYRAMTKNQKAYSLFFFGSIFSQIEGLNSIIEFKLEQIQFASQYIPNRSLSKNSKYYGIDYFVSFVQNGRFIFLGLERMENGVYRPWFLNSTDNLEKRDQIYQSILPNQNVMNVSGIEYPNGQRLNYTIGHVDKKVRQILELTKQYNCHLDVVKDLLFSIKKSSELITRFHGFERVIMCLTQNMKAGVPFDEDQLFKMDGGQYIKELISTYNGQFAKEEDDLQRLIKK